MRFDLEYLSGNSMVLRVEGVGHNIASQPVDVIADATVSAAIVDADGTSVWCEVLEPVEGEPGSYQVVIPADAPLTRRTEYWCTVVALWRGLRYTAEGPLYVAARTISGAA